MIQSLEFMPSATATFDTKFDFAAQALGDVPAQRWLGDHKHSSASRVCMNSRNRLVQPF